MKRIIKSQFAGKFAKNGSLRYIRVPASVVERMGLKEGEYLDITIRIPKREECEPPETGGSNNLDEDE